MLENIDKRKLLIWVIIIVALLLIGYVFYLAFRSEPIVTPPGNQNLPIGNLPTIGPGNVNIGEGPGNVNLPGITNVPTRPGTIEQPSPVAAGGPTSTPVLTRDQTLAPQSTPGGLTRFYSRNDGIFYDFTADGTRQALTTLPYYDVQKVTWSPTASSAILEFPDGANILYDFNQQKQYTLPQEMTDFSFAPSGSDIAGKFLGEQESDKWLVTVGSDGSNLKGIEPLGANADRVQVAWSPNNQVVALSLTGEPSGLFNQEVLLIGLHGENFKSLQVEGRGFEARWSADGQKLLYNVYSDTTDYLPNLYLVNASGNDIGFNKQSLGLATWVDKCVVSQLEAAAYCAVPQNLPAGSGYVRELAYGVPDAFYRVDLTTGTNTLIANPLAEEGRQVSATSLTLSSDGRILYFVDELTSQLRSLQLAP